MLNPDITSEIENALYDEVRNIYSSYLDTDSPDYVHLSQHVSEGIKNSKEILFLMEQHGVISLLL